MQIAKQVYGLNTVECAMRYFKNGSPTYITNDLIKRRRRKVGQREDFATRSGKNKDNAGLISNIDHSYEEVGILIQKYVHLESGDRKYFLVTFNFLFSNGDAHLKISSLLNHPKVILFSPA